MTDLPPQATEPTPRPESPYLSEGGKRVRDAATALIPLLRRDAPAAENSGDLTPEVVQALDDAGVFKLSIPVEYGGYAAGARDLTEVSAALGRGDGSAAWMTFVQGGLRMVAAFPEPVAKEILAEAGTWVGPLVAGGTAFSAAPTGTARKVEGGWMVTGTWHFASGSKHAAWLTAGVELDAGGQPGRAIVVFRRDQVEILDNWKVMGLAGTSSNSFTVREEVFVPGHRLIDLMSLGGLMAGVSQRYGGLGFKSGPQGSMLSVSLTHLAIALGMAEGAFECFVEQANSRKPFNLPYATVAEMPSTQVTAGKARAMINAAGSLILDRADEVDRLALAGRDLSGPEMQERTMDLAYAAQVCSEAIDMMQNALGSSTVSLKNPIQRFARDTRVLVSHGATRLDPTAELSGRILLGQPPLSTLLGGGAPKGDER